MLLTCTEQSKLQCSEMLLGCEKETETQKLLAVSADTKVPRSHSWMLLDFSCMGQSQKGLQAGDAHLLSH